MHRIYSRLYIFDTVGLYAKQERQKSLERLNRNFSIFRALFVVSFHVAHTQKSDLIQRNEISLDSCNPWYLANLERFVVRNTFFDF